MQKYLLLALFAILFVAQSFGIELSLAPGLSVKNLFLYAMLALMLLTEVRDRKLNSQFVQSSSHDPKQLGLASVNRIHVLYAILIFYSLVSMLFVMAVLYIPDYNSLQGVISFKTDIIDRYLFLLVFFYGLTSIKESFWMLKLMLGIIIVGNLITLADALDFPDLGIIHQREDGRVSGPMGESNQYAAFLVLFLPLTVYTCFITKGFQRMFFVVGSVVSLGVLLLAASRGAVVGLALSGLLVTAYVWKHVDKRYFFSAGLGLTIAASAIVVFVAIQSDGLLTDRFIEQSSGGYGSSAKSISSGRTEIWEKAIKRMNKEPITYFVGYGWATWESADEMARLYQNVTKYNMAPHNTYLAYLFEIGAVGLGLILAILVSIIFYLKRSLVYADRESSGVIIAFLYGFVALLGSIVFVDLFNPWLYVWSLIGIILRIAYEAFVSCNTADSLQEDAPDVAVSDDLRALSP